jgi:allantoin racemase
MTVEKILGTAKRLLVVNPNTNPRITRLVRTVAERLAVPGIDVQVVNPKQGPFSIETASDREAAEPQVIDIIRAASDDGIRGFALACFDDIGVSEGRRITAGPVVDACEAGVIVARCLAERFSIITTVESAVPRIERLVAKHLASAFCSVHAAKIGVADAASGVGDAKLNAAIADALSMDGAEAVILGSGGFAGRADYFSERFNIPVIDGVAAAISLCQSILRLGAPHLSPLAHSDSS